MQQVELARRVGVSKAAVSHWLDGTTKFIRPEHLVSIADALGLELRWLITGRGPRLAKDGPPMDFDNNDMDLLQAPPEVKIIFRHILAATKKAS
jgi:transcriptional regulator with XRE-family HTH domain